MAISLKAIPLYRIRDEAFARVETGYALSFGTL